MASSPSCRGLHSYILFIVADFHIDFLAFFVRCTARAAQILLLFLFVLTGPASLGLKVIFKQSRPSGSCLTSCGMPSGHSTFAMALFVYNACDYMARERSMPAEQQRLSSDFSSGTTGASSTAVQSTNIGIAQLALVGLLLLPVPWSRVQLHDHSLSQVLCGSALGSVLALAYFGVASICVAPRAKDICRAARLNDDYTPPVIERKDDAVSASRA